MAMSEKVEVRPCVNHGCDGCDRFFEHLIETPQGRDALHDRFEGTIKHNMFLTTPYVVCAYDVDANIPIGVCNATLSGNTGQLALLVDPEHQRQGYAKQLVTTMGNQLRTAGATQVIATISGGNMASRGLAVAIGASIEYDRAARESYVIYPLK